MHKFLQSSLLAASVALFVGCQADVVSGVSEEQANQVLSVLVRRGVDAEKTATEGTEGAFAVRVPSAEVAEAIDVLNSESLPRTPSRGMEEAFGTPSLVPTPTEERARWISAVSNDLVRTMESMEDVVEARVHIALPEVEPWVEEANRPKPSASVLLQTRSSNNPASNSLTANSLMANDIASLVSHAVQDLTPDRVAVVVRAKAPQASVREVEYVRVGPISVRKSSASSLKWILAGLLISNVVFVAATLFLVVRKSRSESEAEEA